MITKRKKERKNISILSAALVLMLVVVLLLVVNFHQSVHNERQSAQNTLSDFAQAQAVIINTEVKAQYTLLETFSNALSAQNEIVDVEDPENLKAFEVRMSAIVEKSTFYNMSVAFPGGTAYYNNGATADYSHERFFYDAINGKRVIDKIDGNHDGEKGQFIIGVPILKNGKVIAALFAQYHEEDFKEIILTDLYNSTEYSFICNSDGQMIVSGVSGRGFSDIKNIFVLSFMNENDSSVPAYMSLRENLLANKAGTVKYSHEGNGRYAVYKPLGINDWFVFTATPIDAIGEQSAAALKQSVLLIVAIIAIETLCAYLILGRERSIRRILAAESRVIATHEEEYRIAVQQSGKTVLSYDYETNSVHFDSRQASGEKLPDEITDIPTSVINLNLFKDESKKQFLEFCESVKSGKSPITAIIYMRALGSEQYK